MKDTSVFPTLHTERLDLVELLPIHAADLFRLLTDERVTEYYPVYAFGKEEDLLPVISQFAAQLQAGQCIRWGITQKGMQNIIGTIAYISISHYKATVLFALMPEYHNKGYVTEALKAVTQYGFDTLKLKRIDAEVMPGNTASDMLLAKVGFIYEGLLRQWMCWDGRHYDIKMYSLINEK